MKIPLWLLGVLGWAYLIVMVVGTIAAAVLLASAWWEAAFR